METDRICYWCEKPITRLRWVGMASHHGVKFVVRFCTRKCLTAYTTDAKKRFKTIVEQMSVS